MTTGEHQQPSATATNATNAAVRDNDNSSRACLLMRGTAAADERTAAASAESCASSAAASVGVRQSYMRRGLAFRRTPPIL